MADLFTGFGEGIPVFEDEELHELDPTLTNLEEGETYDQLNDDTFGSGALEDDWELSHRKLSGLHSEGTHEANFDEWLKKKGFGLQSGDLRSTTTKDVKRMGKDDPADELDREEEILEQNLSKLVDDDDDADSIPIPRRSNHKDIKHPSSVNPVWDGTSPLSSPSSTTSIHDLISPSSNIWGSPSKRDKENANKGPVNTRQSPLAELLKAETERKRRLRRPFSPAFEDDAIVTAIPPPGLIPPSRFMKKPPPVNAIKLEDLEKELTGDSNTAPQQVPEGPKQTPRKTMIGQPPPGIPRPMMTPPGLPSPASARMHTPARPPQMFQQRPSPSNHSIPGMSVMPGMSNMPGILGPVPGPGPHMLRTPRTPFPRPPFPMIHSDPGHLMLQRGMLNFPMSPQHPRFASPQFHNRRFPDPRQNFPRQQYDNRFFSDNRSPRQQERGEHQHQFTDLERKIHNILTAAERGPRKDDPYAGLMTRREKEWLIKIQLIQLTSDEPELDDYYFQTYTRRKVAKEREKQNEGVQLRPNIEDNRKSNETTKMALPQFEREKKTYTPTHYQGTLGKVSSASVQHPRQMVDLMHITKTPEQEKHGSSTPMKETKRRGQLLLTIEKGYDHLLNVESLDKKLIHLEEEERNELVRTRQLTVTKLFNLLKLSTDDTAKCDDEFFVQFLLVLKGKLLLSRCLPMFNTTQIEAVLMAITRNIVTLIKKDANEETLPHLMVPLTRMSELVSSSVVVHCLKGVVFAQPITNTQASPLRVLLVNQFGLGLLSMLLGRAAIVFNSLTESEDEIRKSWLNIVSRVAIEFQDVPVKQLGRNLEAADRLVALLSTCTDLQTKALLQEHLRLATSAKSEITA